MPEFVVTLSISNDYVKLIKKETYEPILLHIINASENIFPDTYRPNTEQSNGESDFVNNRTSQNIDAKLLFQQEQCRLISKGKDEFRSWIYSIENELSELFDLFADGYADSLKVTILYKEMFRELSKIKKDSEDALLFLPFPVTMDCSGSITGDHTTTVFNQIYNEIENSENSLVNGKIVYIIYPSLDNKIVLRNLSDSSMAPEFLDDISLSKFICFKQVND